MIIKITFITIFVLSILMSFSFSGEEDFLKELIYEALQQNPHLNSLKNAWGAEHARILSKKSLPQPKVSFTYFGESIQTKVGPQDKKYGVRQEIPFPAKLLSKGKIATKEAEIAYIKYLLGIREVIKELKSLFYDYYFVRASIRALTEEKLILSNMRKSVQRRYEALGASQQDLIKADLAINKIEDRTLRFKKQKNFLRAQINKLLGRPQDKRLNIPFEYKISVQSINNDKAALLDKALETSPLVLLDKLGVDKQALKLSLAKQGYLPDFGLEANYIDIGDGTTNLSNDGDDAWMVGVSVTVPLWFWKINSDIKSERLRLDSVRDKLEDKENLLSFKIEDLYFELETDYRLIDLYKNVILPQAEQNFSTSRTSYEQGSVDFLNWLDAERDLINIRIAWLKQIVDYRKIIAHLEYIVGEDLE